MNWHVNRILRNDAEMILGLGDLNEHDVKRIDGLEVIHRGNGFGERNMKEKCCYSFAMKRNHVLQTLEKKK